MAAEAGARLRRWLVEDELRHSRLLGRLRADERLDPPWPYAAVWFDPAGAALVDLTGHPTLGGEQPWFQAAFDDPAAFELLAGVRLPVDCHVLVDCRAAPLLSALGEVTVEAALDVRACAPGDLGDSAVAYEPVRLTSRHRALCAEADWRPEDLADETDEALGGVRWALLRSGHIASRLLVQRFSETIAEIADVATVPEYRRRGYAAALVQTVMRRLHERGLTVTYSHHPDNEPSAALAEAVGFKPAFSWARYRLRRS